MHLHVVSLVIVCATSIRFSTLKSGRNDLQKGGPLLMHSLTAWNELSNAMQTHSSLSYFVVWEYVLLQFGSPGTLFLSTISRQSLSLQESAKKERKSPYMLS